MEKVLITGVTGFIGSHLALRLSGEGYEVYGITKPSVSKDMANFRDFLKDVKVLNCDISDYHAVSAALRRVDANTVVHLAALSPVRDSFERPFSYAQSNIIGTMNIAHALLDLPDPKKRRMIYASTAEVYGAQTVSPIIESANMNPTSPYAVTKISTDMYLRMMTRVYGLNTTVMRCTNTYGRKLDTSFFIEYLITGMLKGDKVYIGAPDSVRDYMYVDDHVDAYARAIAHPEAAGEAFNFGGGAGISNRDVAFKVADMIGYDRKGIMLGEYPPGYPFRPIESDQPFIVLESAKALRMLGWKQTVSLEDGLGRAIGFWRKKLGK
jgi:dTDP-glucose 4,6-dehydratase